MDQNFIIVLVFFFKESKKKKKKVKPDKMNPNINHMKDKYTQV